MNYYVFLGAPGSGKGTQAQHLAHENATVAHIATGQLLRDTIASGTEFGEYLDSIIREGKLITDQMMSQILQTKLDRCSKFSTIILDGYPRTVYQADLLDTYIKKTRSSLKKVVYFDIDDDLLVKRITGRYNCASCGTVYHKLYNKPVLENQCDNCKSSKFEQRKDDTLEVVTKRLTVYHEQTKPLVDYYSDLGLLVKIDAALAVRDIAAQLDHIIKR